MDKIPEIDIGASLTLLHGFKAAGRTVADSVTTVYSDNVEQIGATFKELSTAEPGNTIERLGVVFDINV